MTNQTRLSKEYEFWGTEHCKTNTETEDEYGGEAQ